MRLSKNDILEIVSCLLLVFIIILSYSNEKVEFFTGFLILLSISVFSVITFFSSDEKERQLGLLKCECMAICLCLMINLYFKVNILIPILILVTLLIVTASKEIKK